MTLLCKNKIWFNWTLVKNIGTFRMKNVTGIQTLTVWSAILRHWIFYYCALTKHFSQWHKQYFCTIGDICFAAASCRSFFCLAHDIPRHFDKLYEISKTANGKKDKDITRQGNLKHLYTNEYCAVTFQNTFTFKASTKRSK